MKRLASARFPMHLIALGLLAAALAACSSPAADPSLSEASPHLIEPAFEQFYDFLGGSARMGKALTSTILEGNVQKQYLENGLMIYDPSLPASEQYSLAPLGEQLGVWDQPVASTDMQGVLVVDGYIVYEGFVPLYEELGGRRYVGRPLTGVRYIAEQNRVEQYFQNLGFFMQLDKPGEIHLMAYGRLACGAVCDAPAANPAAIIQLDLPYAEPFVGTSARLGDAFIGSRLAGPYQAADGSLEVIYQNLVLFANADSTAATARPIMALMGIAPEPLVTQLDSPVIMFYGVDGAYGYNVPLFFSDYLAAHGGFEVSGPPISEIKMQPDGTATQCFANLCLSYVPGGTVTPLAMGAEYKKSVFDQPAVRPAAPAGEVRMQVWEDQARISSSEQQVIHASLYSGTQLLAGLQPYLELQLPSGATSIYQFPPSDASGQTQVTVPMVNGQNGTLVPYKVCLEGFGSSPVCVSESYMIWGN